MLDSSYWQFVVHGQGGIVQMSLVSAGLNLKNMKVSINDGSDWKTWKTGCKAVRFLLDGCLAEVADKKELLGLLFDFFGRTLHASWKQKSGFVMFAP